MAPNRLASSSLPGSRSTAMITEAPASRAPATAAHPTPPQPKTATESPGSTPPVYIAAPRPAMTPHPSRPAVCALASGFDRCALAGGHECLVGERADPESRRQLGAVGKRHLLRGVERREAVPRLSATARPALAADCPPVEHDEITGLDRRRRPARRPRRSRRLRGRAGRGSRR